MKVIRWLTGIIMVGVVAFTAFYGRYQIKDINAENSPTTYKGIITLWQIDSFEGGTGSRKQFLLSVAREFEKRNRGVLIMVVSHTPTSVMENFNQGIYPDLISFGVGVEVKRFSELNVSRKVSGGLVGEKAYATAWCRGGYVLIANPELCNSIPNEIDNLLVSQGKFNLPLVALALEKIKVNKVETLAPMDAYIKFVQGKTPYFLGTQRDVCRLNTRGYEFISKPLTVYNDLYQYICVTSEDQSKRYYSQKFVEYLCSDNVQNKLNKISMFSAFTNSCNDNSHLTAMQEQKNFSTISAFTPSIMMEELNTASIKAINGGKDDLNKIIKMLV